MLAKSILVLLISFSALAFNHNPPVSVTGSLCTVSDPDFSEFRYAEHIPYCERNVSTGTKTQIYRDAGVPESQRNQYTIDHFQMLSVGGTNHRDNLWAEHKSIKARRGNLEFNLYQTMLDGCLEQKDVIAIIKDSKLDPAIMSRRPYADFPSLWDYAQDRGFTLPECATLYDPKQGY
jgi:hypothetical protein